MGVCIYIAGTRPDCLDRSALCDCRNSRVIRLKSNLAVLADLLISVLEFRFQIECPAHLQADVLLIQADRFRVALAAAGCRNMDCIGECQKYAILIVGSYKVLIIGSLLQILLGIACPGGVSELTEVRTARCGKNRIPHPNTLNRRRLHPVVMDVFPTFLLFN